MRYLVTGAGLLGSRLANRLAADHDLVVLDAREPDVAPPGRLLIGDIRDPEVVRRAAEGVDGIFHTAALHGIHTESHTPTEFMEINVVGTFNVLEAAVAAGVQRVVFSSSTAVMSTGDVPVGGPVEPVTEDTPRRVGDTYGITKLFGEQMLEVYAKQKGLEAVALRYGAIRQLVARLWGVDHFWALSGLLTDIDDAISANALAMSVETLPRGAYYVTPTSLLDADLLARHDWEVKAALLERLPWVAEHALPEAIRCPRMIFDASVTERELGLRFAATQEDFLREAMGLAPSSAGA